MIIYKGDAPNLNPRKDNIIKRIYYSLVVYLSGTIIGFLYFISILPFLKRNDFKKINVMILFFFLKIWNIVCRIFLLIFINRRYPKNIIPEDGHIIIFNHVNEFEYPFDPLEGNCTFLFDKAMYRSGLLYFFIQKAGILLKDGARIKESIDEAKDYLEYCNIGFMPEGERSFSDEPIVFKKGLLKFVFQNNFPLIVFYKKGMANLNRIITYNCSEIIYPDRFLNFEDFYIFLTFKMESIKDQLT